MFVQVTLPWNGLPLFVSGNQFGCFKLPKNNIRVLLNQEAMAPGYAPQVRPEFHLLVGSIEVNTRSEASCSFSSHARSAPFVVNLAAPCR